jgi:hypothetical protein
VRGVVVVAIALVVAPTAHALPPTVAASASTTAGAAPLRVAFTASGDASSYHWSFGDGAQADGPAVEHLYGAGAFTAQLTAVSLTGETTTKSFRIQSFSLTAKSSRVVTYRKHLRFRGRLIPGVRGMRVGIYGPNGDRRASGLTRRGGLFRIDVPVTAPGDFTARFGGAVSTALPVRIRPAISARFVGSGITVSPLSLVLDVRPATALRVEIRRGERRLFRRTVGAHATLRLPAGTPAQYRAIISTQASPGYAAARLALEKLVYNPRLALGSRGPSVLALNRELNRLHIALSAVDSTFGEDTRDAVVAFQKLHGLPRTGTVDARVWRELTAASVPRARVPFGDHVEVSKPLQVLFLVRGGEVVLVSHVSTGATGNTPVGHWRVYSKTPGWLASGMFDSSFFLRGFAIHGYPSVPFWPASHGCVRLPVWLAPRLYALIGYGTSIYVY